MNPKAGRYRRPERTPFSNFFDGNHTIRQHQINCVIEETIADDQWEPVYDVKHVEMSHFFDNGLKVHVEVKGFHSQTYNAEDILPCIPDRLEVNISNLAFAVKQDIFKCLINGGLFPYPYQILKNEPNL